ncbi:uncharacterized protein LOC125591114 [Brassica napus]|uniref:uncharacterized protein LOC125591114 n=1 Tax=Brassica napus TaxID=3708 RepID=UPI00207A4505|nr:uncharacterized protein LOC125591114 [Brassica napus]
MYWPSPFQQWQQPPYWGPFMPQNQNTRGVLGPRPVTNQQANLTFNAPQLTTDFAHAFNTMQLADPSAADWYMDSGATSHMAANQGSSKLGWFFCAVTALEISTLSLPVNRRPPPLLWFLFRRIYGTRD